MAVTALLPVVLMPWLDVVGSKTLAKNYLKVSDISPKADDRRTMKSADFVVPSSR